MPRRRPPPLGTLGEGVLVHPFNVPKAPRKRRAVRGLGWGVKQHPKNRPKKPTLCQKHKSNGTIRQGKKGGLYYVRKNKRTGDMYKVYCK
jgi:hypothetical protein